MKYINIAILDLTLVILSTSNISISVLALRDVILLMNYNFFDIKKLKKEYVISNGCVWKHNVVIAATRLLH